MKPRKTFLAVSWVVLLGSLNWLIVTHGYGRLMLTVIAATFAAFSGTFLALALHKGGYGRAFLLQAIATGALPLLGTWHAATTGRWEIAITIFVPAALVWLWMFLLTRAKETTWQDLWSDVKCVAIRILILLYCIVTRDNLSELEDAVSEDN